MCEIFRPLKSTVHLWVHLCRVHLNPLVRVNPSQSSFKKHEYFNTVHIDVIFDEICYELTKENVQSPCFREKSTSN